MKDYVGKEYHFLKVLEQKRENKRTLLYCKCLRCGNKKWIRADMVTSGLQISCGCYKEEFNSFPSKDLTNIKFGLLTAKYLTGKKASNGSFIWYCECECGGSKEASTSDLNRERVRSCGCIASQWQSEHGKEIGAKTKEACIEGTNIRNLTMEMPSSNTSGIKGVTWDKDRNKWEAQISFKGKHYYLGRYDDIVDAAGARRIAEEKIFGDFLEWYENEYKKNTAG